MIMIPKNMVVFLLLAACSGTSSSSSSSTGGAGPNLDAGVLPDAAVQLPPPDSGVTDAALGGDASLQTTCLPTPVTGACSGQVVVCSNNCSDDCFAKLTLPSGKRYCTVGCATVQDCLVLGDGLACSAEVGTCMPACSSHDECAAQGFTTCNHGWCDTI